jgi:hypothetical protein
MRNVVFREVLQPVQQMHISIDSRIIGSRLSVLVISYLNVFYIVQVKLFSNI